MMAVSVQKRFQNAVRIYVSWLFLLLGKVAAVVSALILINCGGRQPGQPELQAEKPEAVSQVKRPFPRPTIAEIAKAAALERAAKQEALAAEQRAPKPIPLVAPPAQEAPKKLAPPISPQIFIKAGKARFEAQAIGLSCSLDKQGARFIPIVESRLQPKLALIFSLQRIEVGKKKLFDRKNVKPSLELDSGAVRYRHGKKVEERYTLRPEGVEQSFIIPQAPALPRNKDLLLTLKVESSLTSRLKHEQGKATTVVFVDKSRIPRLSYGEAIARDSTGEKIALEITVKDVWLQIRIPAKWLQKAKFPVTIDPIIGTSIVVTFGAKPERHPDIAYDSDNDRFLIVWDEEYSSSPVDHDIKASLYSGDGGVIKSEFFIDASTDDSIRPAIAFAPGTGRYLAVWEQSLSGMSPYIVGALLDSQGNITKSSFEIHDAGLKYRHPNVGACMDMPGFYVVWETEFPGPDFDIWGKMCSIRGDVASSGTVISASCSYNETQPAINAFGKGPNPWLVAWTDTRNVSPNFPTNTDIYAAAISSRGTVGSTFAVANSTTLNPECQPKVSSNLQGEWCIAYEYEFSPSPSQDIDILAQRASASGKLGNMLSVAWDSENEEQPAVSFSPAHGASNPAEYLFAYRYRSASGLTFNSNIWVSRVNSDFSRTIEGPIALTSFNTDHAPSAIGRRNLLGAAYWITFERLWGSTDFDIRAYIFGDVSKKIISPPKKISVR
jgi:hypothetical protein